MVLFLEMKKFLVVSLHLDMEVLVELLVEGNILVKLPLLDKKEVFLPLSKDHLNTQHP